ncbi:hypothetical protein ENBRE01_1040 [Enteropsectra breve]|nr:hypothetical protein ENBRE01_1040 [Enteropsectra breve]
MFLSLLISAVMALDSLNLIKQKSEQLHRLTNSSTFYDFFGLSENTTEQKIKKAYRKFMRGKPLKGMAKEVYSDLVQTGFSFLIDSRAEYDRFLKDSKWYYLDSHKNYKTHAAQLLFSALCIFFLGDVLIYLYRYAKYLGEVQEKRAIKKENKKHKNNVKTAERTIYPPECASTKLIGLIRKMIRR